MTYLDVVLFSEVLRNQDSLHPLLAASATASLNREVPENTALCLPMCFQALWLSTEVEGAHFLLDCTRLHAHGLPARAPFTGVQVSHHEDEIHWTLPPSYRAILSAHGLPGLAVGQDIVLSFDARALREMVAQCAEELEQAQLDHNCTNVTEGPLATEPGMPYRQALVLAREQYLLAQEATCALGRSSELDYPAGGRQKMPPRTRRTFRD